MWITYGDKGARLVDTPNAVCWCSRWTSGSANQLARVGGVCTSGEVEGVVRVMNALSRDAMCWGDVRCTNEGQDDCLTHPLEPCA